MPPVKDNYYESHLTFEPVFDEDTLLDIRKICEEHGFRIAELVMKKRPEDTPERSQYDSFATTRSYYLPDIVLRTQDLAQALVNNGYQVWRYKVEKTMIDSMYSPSLLPEQNSELPEKYRNPKDPV